MNEIPRYFKRKVSVGERLYRLFNGKFQYWMHEYIIGKTITIASHWTNSSYERDMPLTIEIPEIEAAMIEPEAFKLTQDDVKKLKSLNE